MSETSAIKTCNICLTMFSLAREDLFDMYIQAQNGIIPRGVDILDSPEWKEQNMKDDDDEDQSDT